MFWINWKILFIYTFVIESNIGLPEMDIPVYRDRMDVIETEQVSFIIPDIHKSLIITQANIIESIKRGLCIFFLMINFKKLLLWVLF